MSTQERHPCGDKHRFYIACTVGVETEGTVHVIAMCTSCGLCIKESFSVSKGGMPLKIEQYPNKTTIEKE